ncbi:MAG: type II toxin-antitoxin system HicB family antitoxin [Oscillospiraceae bacterium]|jgi:predicted HicB family RNase H-like nuclease|nr:type II toxin-antitoxin system HicB family antitoxin [Oscillospiraceae bacterium]
MDKNKNKNKKENVTIENENIIYSLDDYLSFPYKRIIYPTGEYGDTAYFAEVLEIDGCCAEGATYVEAYEALTNEMKKHIQMYLNKGMAPPIPKLPKDYSGRILVRMPSSLQYKLAIKAKERNVSVNQLIVSQLSQV